MANDGLEIKFLLTGRCNLKCNYCGLKVYNNILGNYLVLEEEEIKELVKFVVFLYKNDYKEVTFYFFGGEPLIRRKFIISLINTFLKYLLLYIESDYRFFYNILKVLYFRVTTNLCFNENIISEFIYSLYKIYDIYKINVILDISLDFFPKFHNLNRNNSFNKILFNIYYLIDLYFKLNKFFKININSVLSIIDIWNYSLIENLNRKDFSLDFLIKKYYFKLINNINLWYVFPEFFILDTRYNYFIANFKNKLKSIFDYYEDFLLVFKSQLNKYFLSNSRSDENSFDDSYYLKPTTIVVYPNKKVFFTDLFLFKKVNIDSFVERYLLNLSFNNLISYLYFLRDKNTLSDFKYIYKFYIFGEKYYINYIIWRIFNKYFEVYLD